MAKNVLVVGKIHEMLSGLAIFSSAFYSLLLIANLALIIMLRCHLWLDDLHQSVLPVVSIPSLVQQTVVIHAG